ncbi:MAG: McrC family protein [Promethearchaeia archaeon]
MNKSFSVFEYNPISFKIISSGEEGFKKEDKILYLYEKTLEQIEKLNKRFKNKILKIYHKKIIFKNYVGIIKIGNLSIEILPKFIVIENSNTLNKKVVVRNLFFMLQYTPELNVIQIDPAKIDYKGDIYEIIINIFARKLLFILNYKKFKNYRYINDNLNYIRERIDIKKHLTNLNKFHKIPCIYHELTMNNLINRIFKYTINIMLFSIKNNDTYKLLKKIDSILFNVDNQPISLEKIERISYNRMNIEFKPFIDFCYYFLKNCSISMNHSKFEFFSLLIPMELLFERFIANFIKNNFKKIVPIKPNTQKSIGYLIYQDPNKALYKLKPDISFEDKIIIDTKYKILKETENNKFQNYGVKQSDLYQIYAYCKESGAKKCMLLYPENNEGKINRIELNWKLGKSKEIDLYIRTIKLSYDFSNNNELNEFVNELKSILEVLFQDNSLNYKNNPN